MPDSNGYRGDRVSAYLALFPDARMMSGEWKGPCPVCGGEDRFWIVPSSGVFGCRGCEPGKTPEGRIAAQRILDRLSGAEPGFGLPVQPVAKSVRRETTAVYYYSDWQRTIRREWEVHGVRKKDVVPQVRKTADARWSFGRNRESHAPDFWPLYGSIADTGIVLVVEGEKVVDACADMVDSGYSSVTWQGGCKRPVATNGIVRQALKDSLEVLRGRDVWLIPDNDPQGVAAMNGLQRMLHGIASSVEIRNPWHAEEHASGFDLADLPDAAARLHAVESAIPERTETAQVMLDDPEAFLEDAPMPDQIREALGRMGIRFRRNVRSYNVEFSLNWYYSERLFSSYSINQWFPVSDGILDSIIVCLSQSFKVADKRSKTSVKSFDLLSKKEIFHTVLNSLAHEHVIDPFMLWLRALPEWDGVDRVESIFPTLFRTPDTAIARWAGRFVVTGPIYRALAWDEARHGVQLDQMLVLKGPKGVGKSTFVRALAPPEHRMQWITDSFQFANRFQRDHEVLEGAVWVEITEMRGAGRADWKAIKAQISRPADKARRPYGRIVETRPRVVVFVGTTDQHVSIQHDESGYRRFVFLDVLEEVGGSGKGGVLRYMDLHREQIFAEALHKVEAGQIEAGVHWDNPRLPHDLREAVDRTARENVWVDESLEALALDAIAAVARRNDGCVSMVEVLATMDYIRPDRPEPSRNVQERLKVILAGAGYVSEGRHRIDHPLSSVPRRIRVRTWRKAATEDEPPDEPPVSAPAPPDDDDLFLRDVLDIT